MQGFTCVCTGAGILDLNSSRAMTMVLYLHLWNVVQVICGVSISTQWMQLGWGALLTCHDHSTVSASLERGASHMWCLHFYAMDAIGLGCTAHITLRNRAGDLH
jgi:hypothetical protein